MGFKSVSLRTSALVAVVAAFSAGCSPIERFHGYIPPAQEIAALQVGVTTKEDIIATLGRPVTDGTLATNTMYYASSQFRTFGPFAPQVVDRQVLAIELDANDRVRNISRYTLEDGRVVVLERRVTEDGIRDVTVLSQLLGSLGRFDAGTFLGEE